MVRRSRVSVAWVVAGVVTAAGSWAQPKPPAAPEKIALNFQETPIRDVAKQLSELLDTLVFVDEGVEGQVTLTGELSREAALRAVAEQVQAIPAPVVAFCTAEEAKGTPRLRRTSKVKLNFPAETAMAVVARDLARQAMMPLVCTPAAADLKVICVADEQDLAAALDTVAAAAKVRWVQGVMLFRPDARQMLRGMDEFGRLTSEQQKSTIDEGIDRFLADYRKQSPEERRETVQRIVAGIDSVAAMLRNQDEETRSRFKEGIAPMLQAGVRRFVTLDAREQAELGPVMQALRQLQ